MPLAQINLGDIKAFQITATATDTASANPRSACVVFSLGAVALVDCLAFKEELTAKDWRTAEGGMVGVLAKAEGSNTLTQRLLVTPARLEMELDRATPMSRELSAAAKAAVKCCRDALDCCCKLGVAAGEIHGCSTVKETGCMLETRGLVQRAWQLPACLHSCMCAASLAVCSSYCSAAFSVSAADAIEHEPATAEQGTSEACEKHSAFVPPAAQGAKASLHQREKRRIHLIHHHRSPNSLPSAGDRREMR